MISEFIDLDRYPIDQTTSDAYRAIVSTLHEELLSNKLLNIEGFLTEAGTRVIAQEVDHRSRAAYHSVRSGNPYACSRDNKLSADHPYNIESDSDRYGLAHHQLEGSVLDQVYKWNPVRRFVGDILGINRIYLHEDPSNALVVQIYKTDGGLAWHFDKALFSTILNLRDSEVGGTFEFVPELRSATDPCFGEVRDVLLNRSSRVECCSAKPGSFTIMYGRNTHHRVN